MAAAFRLVALSTVTLVLGFAVGWQAHRRTLKPAAPIRSSGTSHAAAAATARVAVPERVAERDGTWQSRRATVTWLRSRGSNFAPLTLTGDRLPPELAVMLGLDRAEMEQMEAALRDARRRLDELSIRAASTSTSADGTRFVVTVPALIDDGTAVYRSLLNTLSSTIGAERMQLFNELVGDELDRSFDRFGLNPVEYQLRLKPLEHDAQSVPVYGLKRTVTDVPGRTGVDLGIFASRAEIEARFPVLAHFLPAALDGQPTKP